MKIVLDEKEFKTAVYQYVKEEKDIDIKSIEAIKDIYVIEGGSNPCSIRFVEVHIDIKDK